MTPDDAEAEPGPPAPLFVERLPELRASARLGPLLDLACGPGRHALAAGRARLATVALDRNADFLARLARSARRDALPVSCLRFDLEAGLAPPLRDAACGAVIVFRYLHRPLAPFVARLLAPGGVLLYETFTREQRSLGTGPRNPAFLLEPGELPRLFPGLETIAYDEGLRDGSALARLVARKP